MTNQAILLHRKWSLFLLVGILAFIEGASVHVNHTCSSRSDGQCTRCDGIPQCFDLSDEMNCPQHPINLIPVSEAVDNCRGKGCTGGFPEPPPLPPFSLCDHVDITTKPTTSPTPQTSTQTLPTTQEPPSTVTRSDPSTTPSSHQTSPSTNPSPSPSVSSSKSPSPSLPSSPTPSFPVSTSTVTSPACSPSFHTSFTSPSTPSRRTSKSNPEYTLWWFCCVINDISEPMRICLDVYKWCQQIHPKTPRYLSKNNHLDTYGECFSLCYRSADIRFCLAIVNLCQQCLKIYAKNQRQSDSYYQTVPWRQSVRATTTPLAPRESVVYHTKPAVISSNSNQRWPFSRQGSIPVAHNSQPHSRPTFTNSHSVRTDNTGILPQPSLWHATKMTWYNPTTLSPFHAPQAIVPAQNHLLDLFRLEILQEAF